MEYGAAVHEFLRYGAGERQLSANTLEAYGRDLADFGAWLAAQVPTPEITTETLKAYLHTMVTERKLAGATVRRRMACLRAFCRRLDEAGLLSDPFVGWRLALPRRKRLPRSLTRGEIASLLSRHDLEL